MILKIGVKKSMQSSKRFNNKFKIKNKIKNKTALQLGALFAGAVLTVLGIWRGEATTVLQKAVYICLECIGIG